MKYVLKIFKSLENSGSLLKGVIEKIKKEEQHNKKKDFLVCY